MCLCMHIMLRKALQGGYHVAGDAIGFVCECLCRFDTSYGTLQIYGGSENNGEQWVASGSYPGGAAASPHPFESVSVGGMFEKPP